MASISAFPCSLYCRVCRSSCRTSLPSLSPSSSLSSSFRLGSSVPLLRSQRKKKPSLERSGGATRAVAEEETLVAGGGGGEEEDNGEKAPPADQPVSVAVSPSDMLTMFFKAEGTMDESAVSTVTKALEESEGISDLKVRVVEGIASVELTKQTTVQATGVASNLVEIIQGTGFKLQTLNLSFEDEEDAVD